MLPLQSSCSLTRVAHPQTRGIAWRDVDRVEFRSPELSAAVWAAISGPLNEGLPRTARGEVPAGLNAKWRVYRCVMRVAWASVTRGDVHCAAVSAHMQLDHLVHVGRDGSDTGLCK